MSRGPGLPTTPTRPTTSHPVNADALSSPRRARRDHMTRVSNFALTRVAVIGCLAMILTSALIPLATIAAYAEQAPEPTPTGFNSATVWIGLKNSDDLQTLFDVEVRVY